MSREGRIERTKIHGQEGTDGIGGKMWIRVRVMTRQQCDRRDRERQRCMYMLSRVNHSHGVCWQVHVNSLSSLVHAFPQLKQGSPNS